MANKIPLTYNEIAVLRSFGDLDEASVPQLAVEARLTPTEMSEAIFKLKGKSLVQTSRDGYFAQITFLGSKALRNWEFDPHEALKGFMPNPKSSLTTSLWKNY